MRELYSVSRINCGSTYFKLFKTPIVFESFVDITFICLFHEKFSSKNKPRKLKLAVCSIIWLFIFSVGVLNFLLGLWNIIYLVFSWFKASLLFISHLEILSSSELISLSDLKELSLVNRVVSSAYWIKLNFDDALWKLKVEAGLWWILGQPQFIN